MPEPERWAEPGLRLLQLLKASSFRDADEDEAALLSVTHAVYIQRTHTRARTPTQVFESLFLGPELPPNWPDFAHDAAATSKLLLLGEQRARARERERE